MVVVKNNKAEAVVLSCEEYSQLKEIEENYLLLTEATRRLVNNKSKSTISFDEVMNALGVSGKELEAIGDVEIE